MPLAPSPLGLAGSLYSTDEDQIDVGSIDVRSTEQLMVALGGQLDEVVRRASGTPTPCPHGQPYASGCLGRSRTVLEAALAEREHSQ